MSDETTQTAEQDDHEIVEDLEGQKAAAAAQVDSDGAVDAKWSVAVEPRERVSIHYRVTPAGDGKAVTSVTASLVEMKDGMVMDTFAGATVTATLDPREGQGLTGDTGAQFAVFANRGFGQVAAVLAGIVETEDGPRNFFFWRPVDPAS
jgi:hypothetical protein